MNTQDILKMQSCVLRVSIHCDGCKQKVKKLLRKIDGVYSTSIDAEQGKVTVTGNVDPATLVKKLVKSGKHAELWGGQKGPNNLMNNLNMFKNMQMDNGKNGKDNKNSQKGGKDQQKNVQQQQAQFQQILQQHNKGTKDLKTPNKDQKSVKFNLPLDDDEFSDEFDDEFSDDGEFDDDDDEFDDDGFDYHQQIQHNKMKLNVGNGNGMMSVGQVKNGGNGKKGGGFEIPIQVKGKGSGKNDGKKENGEKKKSGFEFPILFKGLVGKNDGKKDGNGGKKGSGDRGKDKKGVKPQNHDGDGKKNGAKNGGNGSSKSVETH